ncbi:MAG: TAXI family TRAP transporter solute-binding subunit [Candidatus Adiutrix sp.]
MKIKTTVLALGAMACLCLGMTAPLWAAKAYVSIATGGTSGTYYPIGGAIAQAVTKGGIVHSTAETGNASVANINLVATEEIEIAFVQNDITYWAVNGQQMFKTPMANVRSVVALYPEHVQLIVANSANIKTLEDLKGKRVGIGAPGSGVEADVKAIFDIAGLTYNDMRVDFLDFGATTNRFKDNQIDAGFVVAGFPTASVMDLASSKDISLLNFDSDFLAKLSAAEPFFVPSIIPGKTYSKIDEDTNTPAVMAILITHDKVSDDVIYEFLNSMFTNLGDIQASHAKAREITLEAALDGLTAPLHPGAARFYREKGLLQ